MRSHTEKIEASLFVTCIVDQFYPNIGESTVNVLTKLGVKLDFPDKQTCCGQPAFNSGFWNEAKPLARRFIEIFHDKPYVVIPSGSCAAMVRVFYPELFHRDFEIVDKAKKLSSKVYELSEFIVDVLKVTDIDTTPNKSLLSPKRNVTYHEACHLRRELGVKTQPRTLINSISGIKLTEMNESEVCCGFGGTFSVKYSDISGAMLQDKINNIRESKADTLVTCDSSCLMHIAGGMEKQGIPVKPMHLAELLDEGTPSQK